MVKSMKTVYLSRDFRPVSVTTHKPGDLYRHPIFGECRRVTASRLCLVGERLGVDSEAFLGLLNAIIQNAENDQYDGRPVESWFGLVGLEPPQPPPSELVKVKCPECGVPHWALEEKGRLFENGLCGSCWPKNFFTP